MPAPKQASKRPRASGKGAKALLDKKKKKPKKAADEDDQPYGDLFLDEDDKKKPAADDDGEDAEEAPEETAEEKRLRLARAYLQQLGEEDAQWQGVTGGSDEEGGAGSSGDDEEDETGRDRVARRLKQEAAEASGRKQRKIAHTLRLPDFDRAAADEGQEGGEDAAASGPGAPSTSAAAAAARAACFKGHRLPATAIALSADDSFAVSVSKDGSIVKWNLATMQKTRLYRPGEQALGTRGKKAGKGEDDTASSGADWVKRNPRQASKQGLYAVALSSDNAFLAVGGGDRKVHVFDALSGSFLQSFPGHRDAISALAFREGTHQLFSASYDRTVKMWSLDDRAYMDTLFGHQAEVLALDVGRTERAVTGASDHSCRIWKVQEESQLVFRAPSMSTDCIRLLSQGEFISAGNDGSLQVWNQLRKKPVAVIHDAHGPRSHGAHGGASAGSLAECSPVPGAAPVVPDVTGWVQSLAVCRNSDLAASGAADGTVRLWRVTQSKMGGAGNLECIGGLPVRGCVNGLALSRSGQLLVAAVGQEPRLGRWMRDSSARNGIVVFRLSVA